ncbi:hypothetical protein Cni_G03231 [Canna indica]|uniref:RING-type E3 ubiquitin transferase n=1 Tax=Canna indica TaxID=4628 RepID=A0AAQ3JR93_9LILI|nr:hypothetical protein Cni_G03231 [Canna indica]
MWTVKVVEKIGFVNHRCVEAKGPERDDEVPERNGARAVRRLPGPVNRIPAVNGNAEDAVGAQGIAGAGQIIRRNAENVAAWLEMQAARLEANVEQMFDGLDDADGAEDVPFDELVGMQGPVFHLVENALTVLASNAIFLGVVIFIPFSLGRIVLYYITWFFSSVSSPVLEKVSPISESMLTLANSTLKNALTAAKNLSTESHNEGLLGHMMEVVTGSQKLNATGLDEVSNRVGSRGECVIFGRLYGLLTVAEAIPSLLRQFLAGMRHLMTMVKVAFLLVTELGVFPLMCGWWLDVCTLRMLGTTIAQRVEFFSVSPLASSSIHWLVGIVYMLQISIFVSLLRGVLRNGVLYFLRDPADPNYNPFRDLIDDPVDMVTPVCFQLTYEGLLDEIPLDNDICHGSFLQIQH